jgi:two-component system CheB/CheR fusion protein
MELDEDDLQVLADPTDLNQVVLNLVINAHEACDPEAGRIVVRTRPLAMEDWDCPLHGSHKGGPYVQIEVSDSGSGIEEAILARIFEPYFSTKVQGRGLGLAAVAGIVAANGGCIEVHSRPGLGSTFQVLLPRHAGPATQPPARTDASARALSGRILLIEDEETVRFVASRVLKRAGYQVVAAVDGQDGLEALEGATEPFDIILADAKMPRLGGIELAARLADSGSQVPLVLCTGYAPAIHSKQAGEAPLPGVSRLLQKPYSGEELLAVVAEFLTGDVAALQTACLADG